MGIKCVDGVVLGVEKIISQKLLAPSSNKKIKSIDKHAGMALAGIAGDAEKLVLVGREEAQKYWDFYGNQASGSVLAKRIA